MGLAAVLGGARSFVAIGEWAAHQPLHRLRVLGVNGCAGPDESTIRRVFARLDPDLLDELLGAFMWTRTSTVDGRRVIVLDGKTARRTIHGHDRAALVAALDHTTGTVLGQLNSL